MSTYLSRTPRPQGQHLQAPPTRRLTTPVSQRLNTIIENAGSNTRAPRPSRRAPGFSRHHNTQRSHLGAPPLESDEKPPPSYSQLSGQGGSLDDSAAGEEDQSRFGKVKRGILGRGGWKRLALIVLALLLVIIALAVGLGVGLNKQKKNNNAASATSGDSEDTSSLPYPMGSWNFPAVLASVSTDCTPNAATWTCYPYDTYDKNASGSQYTFNWIITTLDPEAKKPESLQIESGPNQFALRIPRTPLRLIGQGAEDEHYSFSLPLPKLVQPMESITDNGGTTVCYFNQSTLTGSLYTRREDEPIDPLPTGSNTTAVGWPGTVYLSFVSPGGADTPDCYPGTTSASGPRITQGLSPLQDPKDCSCIFESKNGTMKS